MPEPPRVPGEHTVFSELFGWGTRSQRLETANNVHPGENRCLSRKFGICQYELCLP